MTDDKVLKLIQVINEKKSEIGKINSYSYKTNFTLPTPEGNKNLHTIGNISELYKWWAFLTPIYEAYKVLIKGDKSLGAEFKWGGYSYEDWASDIKGRIDKLSIENKKKELEQLEARLNKIVSPELRAKMELEAIEKELGL